MKEFLRDNWLWILLPLLLVLAVVAYLVFGGGTANNPMGYGQ